MISSVVHYESKIKKNYHWCFVDETIDWFQRKSLFRIAFRRWRIDDDILEEDDLGVTLGRYSFNADNDNGGKTRRN